MGKGTASSPGKNAPRVDADAWVRVMSRRIESQLNRDWTFGFMSWNYIFRSSINLSRTFVAYQQKDAAQQYSGLDGNDPPCERAVDDGATLNDAAQASRSRRKQEEKAQTTFTPDMFKEGAKQLCKALWGKYRDLDGKMQSVKGDMTKLRYVAALSGAARRLLANIEHTSRRLPGTQEVRRLMRFDANAMRIRYGGPIFVTFSPDEAHSLLMIRLSRTRRNDPVFAEGSDPVGKRYCGRNAPHLGDLSDVIPQHAMDTGVSIWRDVMNRPSCRDSHVYISS